MSAATVAQEGNKVRFLNWGNNHTWDVPEMRKPTSLEELVEMVKENPHGKLKAFGSLHSWSKVAKTEGLAIDMKGLDKVLELDKKNMTIKCQSGMLLHDLFSYLVKEDLAIETMPNVGHVTLGGILANAVHGTNARIGTFGDQVEEIEIVIANGDVLTLNRHDEDEHRKHLFDACLISFGTLGIIYSLTFRLVPPYAVMKSCHVIPMEDAIRDVVKIARDNPDGLQYIMHQPASCCFVFTKHNMSVSGAGSLMYTERDVMFQMQLSLSYWLFQFPVIMNVVALIFPHVRDMKIYRWDNAEVYPNHTRRFINMEYGMPESTIVETLEETIKIIRRDPERSPVTGIVVRVVGQDSRGYLSPTCSSSPLTYYIDIPYRVKSDKEREFFGELEELFLSKGGRVSMARWFVNPNKDLFRNVDNFDRFLDAKRELDPKNIFGNDLTDLFLL